jgi:hypothetical protein
MAKEDSSKRLRLTMPAAASGATSQVICAAGDISCKVREWSSSSSTVTEMTASCYACDNQATACTGAETQTAGSSGKGVAKYVASVTFTMKQDGTTSTDVLKV